MRCRGPAAQQGVRRGGSLYGGRWRADGPHISQETKNPDPSGMGVGPRGRGRAGLSAVGNRTRGANTALSRRFRKRPECPRGAPKRPLWRRSARQPKRLRRRLRRVAVRGGYRQSRGGWVQVS